jgi:hypothetical protein
MREALCKLYAPLVEVGLAPVSQQLQVPGPGCRQVSGQQLQVWVMAVVIVLGWDKVMGSGVCVSSRSLADSCVCVCGGLALCT